MKQGDLSSIVGSLRFAEKDLHARWEETRRVWRDEVSARFGETHLAPLEEPMTGALRAMERLGLVLMQAYDACSPDRE